MSRYYKQYKPVIIINDKTKMFEKTNNKNYNGKHTMISENLTNARYLCK